MNTQLRIAFLLAFSVIGGAALAEDGGAVGTPTSEASQPIATAAHLGKRLKWKQMRSRSMRRRARKRMA